MLTVACCCSRAESERRRWRRVERRVGAFLTMLNTSYQPGSWAHVDKGGNKRPGSAAVDVALNPTVQGGGRRTTLGSPSSGYAHQQRG